MSHRSTVKPPAPVGTDLTIGAPPSRRLLVEETVSREAPALLSYLVRRVAEPADAAELLGDVLVVVWRRADAMPLEPGSARMWMFGIARKVLAGGRRTSHRRSALTERLRHELIASASNTADLAGRFPHETPDPRIEHLSEAV